VLRAHGSRTVEINYFVGQNAAPKRAGQILDRNTGTDLCVDALKCPFCATFRTQCEGQQRQAQQHERHEGKRQPQ
jgi:hypothetical protein